LKVLLNNQIHQEEWNHVVNNSALLRFEWSRIIQETYALEPYFALLQEGDSFALVGAYKTSKGYISLPFLSYSGFHASDEHTLNKLKDFLRNNTIEIDARNKISLTENPHYVTSVIEVQSMEGLWKNLSTNMRNQIRKSQTYGFEIKLMDTFTQEAYMLYAKAMHRLGTPVHKKLFFEKILEYISESVVIGIYDKDKMIGFMLCVFDDKTLYDLFAATDPKYNQYYANYFLYYEALNLVHEKGLIYFDMGRSTYGSSVHKFKQKWKPVDFSITSSLSYSKSGSLWLISKIWQKLPFAITLWLGPKLRKYLP